MRLTPYAAALVALLSSSSQLQAQTPCAPPWCDTPAHRQFDFWMGDWIVIPGCDTAGTNLVALAEAGLIVQELAFSRNSHGSVRQYWQPLTDPGATWAVAFDGLDSNRQ